MTKGGDWWAPGRSVTQHGPQIRALENRLDLMIYELCGLTWPEVKIVDPAFAVSEVEYNRLEFAFERKEPANS